MLCLSQKGRFDVYKQMASANGCQTHHRQWSNGGKEGHTAVVSISEGDGDTFSLRLSFLPSYRPRPPICPCRPTIAPPARNIPNCKMGCGRRCQKCSVTGVWSVDCGIGQRLAFASASLVYASCCQPNEGITGLREGATMSATVTAVSMCSSLLCSCAPKTRSPIALDVV